MELVPFYETPEMIKISNKTIIPHPSKKKRKKGRLLSKSPNKKRGKKYQRSIQSLKNEKKKKKAMKQSKTPIK